MFLFPACCRPPPVFSLPPVPKSTSKSTSICDDAKLRWQVLQSGTPRGLFVLHRDGRLVPPPGPFTSADIAFRFDGLDRGDEARLRISDANDDAGLTTIACGPIDPSVPVRPGDWSSAPDTVVVLETYGKPRDAEVGRTRRVLLSARAPLIAALEPAERDEVRRRILNSTVITALRAAVMQPGDPAAIARASKEAHGTQARLAGLEKTWCGREANSPLAPVICGEIETRSTQLTSIIDILDRTATAAGNADLADMLKNAKFNELVATLGVPDRLSTIAETKQCDGVDLVAWLSSEPAATPRLLARARLPWVGSNSLVDVQYGQNGDDVLGASTSVRYGLLVLDAPVAKPGSFASHQGGVVSADVSSLLLATIRPALNALPPHGIEFLDLDTQLVRDSVGKTVKTAEEIRPSTFSLVCDDKRASKSTPMAAQVDSVASIESRAFMFGPIPQKYSTDVVACEGSACSGTVDDKQVRSRRTLVPDQTGRLTLLADVSAGVGIASLGRTAPGSHLGFQGQTAPGFQPVLGAGSSDQLYQLRQEVSPQSAFTTSLLLGVHVRRCMVGAGPSLLVGGSGSLLTQLSVHAGCPVFPKLAPGVHLTAGFSLRFVPAPDAYRIGAIVDVPVPSSGNVQPPPITTHETGLLQFDLGIAIDIGGAANTLSSTISSLGGGK